MLGKKAVWTMAALFTAGLLLAGCEEDEQDRVLMYEPGVYKGQEDSGLSEKQLNELRSRVQGQSGS